jgi:hypothetical protein
VRATILERRHVDGVTGVKRVSSEPQQGDVSFIAMKMRRRRMRRFQDEGRERG